MLFIRRIVWELLTSLLCIMEYNLICNWVSRAYQTVNCNKPIYFAKIFLVAKLIVIQLLLIIIRFYQFYSFNYLFNYEYIIYINTMPHVDEFKSKWKKLTKDYWNNLMRKSHLFAISFTSNCFLSHTYHLKYF